MLIRVVARAAAVTVAVGLLGVGCAGDSDTAAPAPTPPASASATAAPTDPAPTATPPPTLAPTATATAPPTADAQADLEAAVLEAHAGYLEAFADSGSPPRPNHPGLRRYATGEALEVAQTLRRGQRERGEYVEGGANSQPSILEISQTRAVVADCLIDNATVYSRNGAAIQQPPNGAVYYETVIVLTAQGWQVSELLTAGQPCAD